VIAEIIDFSVGISVDFFGGEEKIKEIGAFHKWSG
jgi:hypothetical protein